MRGADRSTRHNKERGSTMVEFGLILLPLFAFLFLTMDMAWAIFASASLQEGAREGARFAITGQTLGSLGQDASIRQKVQQYSFGFVTAANAATSVQIHYYDPTTLNEQTGTGSNNAGNVVKVVVTGLSLKPLMPLWRSSSPIPLSVSASDIMEPPPGGTPPPR